MSSKSQIFETRSKLISAGDGRDMNPRRRKTNITNGNKKYGGEMKISDQLEVWDLMELMGLLLIGQ